ncbi:hypothetical protein GQ53DRAFT_765100 [Thozetella sp. PMI_491]|nr:hypothetical protein GQ53DRAFT_765100 [Thozetella sp. PMI_491]
MSNSDTKVLSEILGALKRLETGLENQNGRLYTLERCISPGSASSTSQDSPVQDGLWTPSIKIRQPIRLGQQRDPITPPSSAGSHTTSPPGTPIPRSDAKRFEFEDVDPDVENPESSEDTAETSDVSPAPQIEYAYTESVYTSLSRSRLDLVMGPPRGASPPPAAIVYRRYSSGYEDGRFSTTIDHRPDQADIAREPSLARLRRIVASRSRALAASSRKKMLGPKVSSSSEPAREKTPYERSTEVIVVYTVGGETSRSWGEREAFGTFRL